MAEEASAAQQAVIAARAALDEELTVLEASVRDAVDIPGKIRRSPAKAAGIAGGVAFLALGGPRRVARAVRRAVKGPEAELPESMLPEEVEKTIRKLGTDGNKVRATLEREFAEYLDERSGQRRRQRLKSGLGILSIGFLRPLVVRAGHRLAEAVTSPDGIDLEAAIADLRARRRPDERR